MSDLSDGMLIDKVRRDDLQIYGVLVQRYQESVIGVCYRLMGNMEGADDMAQEAFIRGYKRLHQYDKSRPFGPWIRKIAANLCISELKKRRIEAELREENIAHLQLDWRGNPEQAAQDCDQSEIIQAALLSLPAENRIMIELRHFHEMNYDEIAHFLKVPLSTVKSRLFRGRKMMAALLRGIE